MATHMAAGRLTARGRPAAAASLHTLRPRAAAVAALRRPTAALAAAVGAAAAFTVRASNSGGHQRPLTNQERKARRAEAQRLGRDLCTVQLGQKGLSPTFLEGFRLAVASNELVKVGAGADGCWRSWCLLRPLVTACLVFGLGGCGAWAACVPGR
jgi:hypothetical protein